MKGDLAVLDRAMRSIVAHELGSRVVDRKALDEIGFAPERIRLIGGLEVVVNTSRDADVYPDAAKTLERLTKYQADREELDKKLKNARVKPLAVLPSTAWEHICSKAELYRFMPIGDTVKVDASELFTDATEASETQAKEWYWKRLPEYQIFTAVVVMIGLGLCYFHSWWWVIPTAIGGLIVGSIADDKSKPTDQQRTEWRNARLRELVADHEKKRTLHRALWPKGTEPAETKNRAVHVEFPEPPPELQLQLVAAERTGLPLHIAAAEEAISFKAPVADQLLAIAAKEAAARPNPSTNDPIAYVVHGSAVAVIAQFGDFPIEKEVMHEVLNSVHFV